MIASSSKKPPEKPQNRLSQFLPTVKCSTCLQPVHIEELGEHICDTPPPVQSTTKSFISGSGAATSSPGVMLVPGRVGSPALSVRSQTHSNHQGIALPPSSSSSGRLRIDTIIRTPVSPTHPTFKPSPLARGGDNDRQDTSSPKPRDPYPNNPTLSSPLRTHVGTPTNGGSALSTPSTARPLLSLNQEYSQRELHSRGPPQNGLSSSPAQGMPAAPPRVFLVQPNISVGPSNSNDVQFPQRPSVSGLQPNGPPPPPPIGYPRRPGVPGNITSAPTPPSRLLNSQASVQPPKMVKSGESFVPPAERGIDTSSGGEAGMAGVGRRGFAAAARAMFGPVGRPMGPQPQRKPNAPQYLDLNVTARQAMETPPLSAGSGYTSHSPGPISPLQQPDFMVRPSAKINTTPSPPLSTPTQAPLAEPALTIVSPSIQNNLNMASPLSPRLPFFEKYKNKLPNNIDKPPSIPDSKMPAPNPSFARGPTSQSSDSASRAGSSASGRNPDKSESDYSGLAYAHSTDNEENEENQRGRSMISPREIHLKESILRSISNGSNVQFGSVSERSRSNDSRIRAKVANSTVCSHSHSREDSISSYSSNAESRHGRTRSNSSAIAQALGLSQTPPSKYSKLGGPGVHNVEGRIARSASGGSISSRSGCSRNDDKVGTPPQLPSRLPELPKQKSGSVSSSSGLSFASRYREEDEDVLNLPGGTKTQRSNTVQVTQSPDAKAIKLPVRAMSEREKEKPVDQSRLSRKENLKARKQKVCLKCVKAIEDGRWISTDGGGILCEKCWKHMYLPKCRRCNLPIERQAVSSSDGQLRGKYHKECFNCHECHKAFPDKTFYVYDGKPLCAYHYHEANDSLCAAARCGQPIEGPCAVSHTGDRYHPEHMTCEYPGYPDCHERLNEYWEVDGRMLCERHATCAIKNGNDDEDKSMNKSKGMKRITRFIDLAGGGGLIPPATSGGKI